MPKHRNRGLIRQVSPTTGFELGNGILINTALPEDSVEFLRSVREDG